MYNVNSDLHYVDRQSWCFCGTNCLSNVFRYTVLTKTPKSKETADTDVFAFNNKFTDRQRKIKMSLLVTKVDFVFG